jgi:hypothetical protein
VDKGNCTVVLDEIDYKNQVNILLDSEVYQPLARDPTAKTERKIQSLLSKYKTSFPFELKRKLTPYYSKPPHLYGLLKIHNPEIPLRPIVNSIGSPCYALAGFLSKILILLADETESFVKNSQHFIQLLKSVDLQSQDTLVSFGIVSLFTNVTVDEALEVVKNKINNEDALEQRTGLQTTTLSVRPVYKFLISGSYSSRR